MDISLATQEKRIAELTTPLGKDVLVLSRFEGGEGLSELFEFRIDALSDRPNIDFDDAIGKKCSVKFKSYGRAERFFNGILVEARWLGVREDRFAYRLVLRPWLWLLSQAANCKIFQNKDAVAIIKDIFSAQGFQDHKSALTRDYPKMEYCVQYRETDLSFVSRLMEQHGIYYFFTHSSDKHTLVLADSKSSHDAIPGSGTIPYIPLTGDDQRDREHIYHLTSERRFRTGKVTLNDYDYLKPNADLKCDKSASERYAKAQLEVYDYPGKYTEQSDGKRFAEVRLQAEQASDHRRHAAGDAVSLYAGGLFRLDGHPSGSENIQHLVVRASHAFTSEAYRSGAFQEAGEVYYGNYELQPGDRAYRAPLVTPKPLVHGPQTAKVVGKEGEEIDVDEHGRITVQFHWDRDKKPSRRVRVAQVWSGKSWGGQVIPRIGQEVVVEFLEGDPDQPLVIGTVYNKDYKYPYEMPDNKTVSGLKSDSSKGGNGYNEFKFEDKKGQEEIGLHAEKDLKLVIRNSETREIGEAFATPQGQSSRKTTLKNGDDELSVDVGDQKITIGHDQTVDVAQNISITAGMQIVLKVGPSTITLDNMGVTIKAPTITLQGDAQVSVEAPITDVKASGILSVEGPLVKIN